MPLDKALFCKYILKFLYEEINSKHFGSDEIESLEVAKQCLESVFHLTEVDYSSVNLNEPLCFEKKRIPTETDKLEAEKFKQQGNMCLSENLIEDAIECYNKAINLVDDNPVYYSNRAAAYTNYSNYEKAIEDCMKSIECDPNYSKAYGRLGLVYSNMGNFSKAVECYKKAYELDPTNTGYKQNLDLAKSKINTVDQNTGSSGPSLSMPAGMDFSNLLSSPQFVNMASQIMSDPNMRNQLTNMMQGFIGSNQSGPTAGQTANADLNNTPNRNEAAAMPDLSAFLQMGEQFAQQMRNSNPELVEQLRAQHLQNNPDTGNNHSV